MHEPLISVVVMLNGICIRANAIASRGATLLRASYKKKNIAPQVTGTPDPRMATTDDIRACFRLLLGREPNPEEWPGHSSLAGSPLVDLVRSFLASRECQARGLLSGGGAEESAICFVNGLAVVVDPNDIDVGKQVLTGYYEPHVTAVFKRHVLPGMRVIDIGANCGYFTSLALSLVGGSGHVWAIEPNPANVRLLELARRHNHAANLTIVPAAAGGTFGAARVYAGNSNGMVGPLADASSIDNIAAQLTLDGLTLGQRIDFVKIDVEGYEGHVLKGASSLLRDQRPHVVLEFTPTGLDGITGVELLGLLRGAGYRIAVITHEGVTPHLDDEAIMRHHQAAGVSHIDLLAVA